ncbi:M-phase phosphoprotein 8-like isoform X2 [Acanthaster planci]|uniref:M-phase phosphoprotein 8-like isoform X2 n=1 Tax=Acanthaster planci TaxID=133434 RepID=A0A8B8A037_ACAPL|nr:M-phase phosphoprotein 8-like isoform X2 [Acanthaster planci]
MVDDKMAAEERAGENSTPESDETIEEGYDFSESENIYEVEKILGVTKHEGRPLYRVRWQGYGPEEDTWEPRENLLTCEDLVEEFIEKQKLRKQKISQNLAKKYKKSPKKRTPPKESSATAQPKRRRSSEKDASDNETANGQSNRKCSSSDNEGPPPLKDPFWDNLEKGLITFDGDMYSKVKSRRATLDAKRSGQSTESAGKDPDKQQQEWAMSRERTQKVIPKKEEVKDGDAKEEATPDSVGDVKPSLVKDEPFLGEGEMLPEDMYSKVKSRRAYLDAKKLEAAKEEMKQTKKTKKEHRHHRHGHHRHKKSKKDGTRKPKTLIDLEAIGSLETATQKTLSMSPSILERETNAANLFHTPDSCLSVEEVLTVAKLEEKTRNGNYGRQLSGQSVEEDGEGDKIRRVLPLHLETMGSTPSTSQAVPLTPSADSKPIFQGVPLQSTSHLSPQGHSPTFHPTPNFPPVPLAGAGIIPDTPESPDDSQKGPGPSVWKPWEVSSQCSISSGSGSSSSNNNGSVLVSSAELAVPECCTMGAPHPKDSVRDLGQDLADKVSLQAKNVVSPTPKEIPRTTTILCSYNNTAKFSDAPAMASTETAITRDAASMTPLDTLPPANTVKAMDVAPVFGHSKPCSFKMKEPQRTAPVPDKVPAWLELQNFVEKDPIMMGHSAKRSGQEKAAKPPDMALPNVLPLSPCGQPTQGIFLGEHHQGSVTEKNADGKTYPAGQLRRDVTACKASSEKKHHKHHKKAGTKPSLNPTKKDRPSEKSRASHDMKTERPKPTKKKEKSKKTKSKINVGESKKKKTYSVRGGIQFDFEEDTSTEEPWAKPGLSPIILSNDALKQAVKDGLTERVREALWLNGTHDLEQQDPACGTTLLMQACMYRHDEIAKLLIANGALVNIVQTKTGLTPLMYAADLGFYNTVAILLEAGAHVNLQQATTGETALMKACKKGHAQIINLLLIFGANWAVTTPSANTALEFAILYKHPDIYDIVSNHINRVVMQFESTINQYLCGTAKLTKPVFPLQCFRIRESTEHHIYLNHDFRQYSHNQGCGNVLFIGHAHLGLNGLMCRLTGHSFVYKVTLNGQDLPQLSQGSNFLLSFLPKNGRNLITVKTICDPYTKMLLLVGAYSLQITSDGPQIGF